MRQLGFAFATVALLLAVAAATTACGPTAAGPDGGGGGDDDAPDASDPMVFPDGAPLPDAAACAAEEVTAAEVTLPVDIIWVIDNSGSMDEEEARVQNNINNFSSAIAASGVDYHVIVISDTSHINVPPPLGGSPQFLAVNQSVGSNNPLELVVQTYPMYQAFLRPSSIKHFVAVTDDESDWSKSMFESSIAALTMPGFGTNWKFHAVVAEDNGITFMPPFTTHCTGLAAAAGQTYINLQTAHPGTFFSLCDTDWTPLFATLSTEVTEGLSLPCTFAIPTPPDGMTIDPTQVNFVYTPTGGAPTTIPNVGSMAACGNAQGWYYDNPAMPTQIIVCPSTCTALEGDPTGGVSVAFGCATVID